MTSSCDSGTIPDSSSSNPATGIRPSPPPYAEDPATVEDSSLPPCTLRLADGFVYSSEGGPDSPPLYELSHQIGFLKETHTTVSLERFDFTVKGNNSNEANAPRVAARKKEIFKLQRPPTVTAPTFPYVLSSTSRGTLGNIGVRPIKGLSSSGYKAWRIVRKGEAGELEQREQLFVATRVAAGGRWGKRKAGSGSATAAAWATAGEGRGAVVYEWVDGAGRMVAVEDEGEAEGMHRLVVIVALDRPTRDALVGVWCVRLWDDIAARNVADVSRWKKCKSCSIPIKQCL